MKINDDYEIIGKCLYLKKEGILCIGDLHLGYEELMKEEGILIPIKQLKGTIDELREVIEQILKSDYRLNKIIILGDIKHYFKYNKEEKFGVYELLEFLREYVEEKNIIFIKGNHDKFEIGKKLLDYFIDNGNCFVHGNKDFLEIWDKKIKRVIIGHLHPSVILRDKKGVKSEKYKCFLVGKYRNKEIIVVPSFIPFIEGSEIEGEDSFSIIPYKELENFEVFVVGDNFEVLNFGKLKELD